MYYYTSAIEIRQHQLSASIIRSDGLWSNQTSDILLINKLRMLCVQTCFGSGSVSILSAALICHEAAWSLYRCFNDPSSFVSKWFWSWTTLCWRLCGTLNKTFSLLLTAKFWDCRKLKECIWLLLFNKGVRQIIFSLFKLFFSNILFIYIISSSKYEESGFIHLSSFHFKQVSFFRETQRQTSFRMFMPGSFK